KGLEYEMQNILREKGLREEDPYEVVVSRAAMLDFREDKNQENIVSEVCSILSPKLGIDENRLFEAFNHMGNFGAISIRKGVVLYQTGLDEEIQPEMVFV